MIQAGGKGQGMTTPRNIYYPTFMEVVELLDGGYTITGICEELKTGWHVIERMFEGTGMKAVAKANRTAQMSEQFRQRQREKHGKTYNPPTLSLSMAREAENFALDGLTCWEIAERIGRRYQGAARAYLQKIGYGVIVRKNLLRKLDSWGVAPFSRLEPRIGGANLMANPHYKDFRPAPYWTRYYVVRASDGYLLVDAMSEQFSTEYEWRSWHIAEYPATEDRTRLEVKVNGLNRSWQEKITREGWTQEKCFDQDKLTKRQRKKRK